MDKILKFADSFKLADLQNYKILGEFNYESYLLKLNCTLEEYMEDFVVFDKDYKSQGNIRTFFHELIHFFQYSTTPIGNYLLQLSNFQTLQAEHIVRNLDRIEYPLIPYIKKHVPVESNIRVWYHLRYWFLSELMRLYYTDDLMQYINISKATTFLEEGLTDLFLEVEQEICKIRKLDIFKRRMNNTHDHERMLMEQTLALTSNNVNVFENHARISEYWWDVAGDKGKIKANQDLFEYSGWILAYKNVSNADTLEQFVSTFSAISELSLFSTILPCENGLSSIYSAFDFAPRNRMYELINKI
ncbi:hypothetical protein [Anaerocolumna sp. MB42-C2]|uniref:hypothetical protein n=1 Tax=Anaerocolumna sp. MB42-C2 TaxID=3070997 RepID=UPI0027E073D6|nr:hypothetical protein [Anaerocolumna sp. MB42-C2]WMJ85824.1 hypothetical protein RBU59_17355 [Anaerocolumna sp. MB42-C2]